MQDQVTATWPDVPAPGGEHVTEEKITSFFRTIATKELERLGISDRFVIGGFTEDRKGPSSSTLGMVYDSLPHHTVLRRREFVKELITSRKTDYSDTREAYVLF